MMTTSKNARLGESSAMLKVLFETTRGNHQSILCFSNFLHIVILFLRVCGHLRTALEASRAATFTFCAADKDSNYKFLNAFASHCLTTSRRWHSISLHREHQSL